MRTKFLSLSPPIQFAWRHYYWYLTNEGIQYLRDYLHLPPEIVPSTLKRQVRAEARPRPSAGGPGGPGGRFGGDRDKDAGDRAAYRRAPGEWRSNAYSFVRFLGGCAK